MIIVLISLLLFFGPLLTGLWNFHIQILTHLFVFIIIALWTSKCIIKNEFPDIFQDRKKILLIFVTIISAVSMCLSPVKNLVVHEWENFLIGIIIIFLTPFLKPKGTKIVNLCLRISAWIVMLVGIYQTLFMKQVPYSSLINPNALAMFILMLIPLSVLSRDWPLLGLLIITLVLTKSSGAILSLSAIAAIYFVRRNSSTQPAPGGNKWGIYIPAIFILTGIIFAFTQVNLKSISDRIMWWKTGFSMILERPLLGFGFAGWPYVYPAFHKPVEGQISTTYAHNYYLEFISENGLICAFVWFWFLVSAIKKLNPAGKYSILAALIHSCIDFGLSIPSNLWIFCFILSSNYSTNKEAVSIVRFRCSQSVNTDSPYSNDNLDPYTLRKCRLSLEYKISLVIIVLALAGFYIFRSLEILKTESLLIESIASYRAGRLQDAIKELKSARVLNIHNPVIPEFLGKIYFQHAKKTHDKLLLFESAVWFEQSLRLNPYNQSVYAELQSVYEMAKEIKLKNDLLIRRGKYFKW